MLRATPPLFGCASTRVGMRRILKKRLPVDRFIELAVKAGTYKSPSTRPNYLGLHDLPEIKGRMTPREREERIKMRRGILDYPTEYEILSMNPPLPMPAHTPVRTRKKMMATKRKIIAKQRKEEKKKQLLGLLDDAADSSEEKQVQILPSMDKLVKDYLTRHESKLREGLSPSEARREEEYYSKLLLGPNAEEEAEEHKAKFAMLLNPTSLQTAMGRKSMLVENAYAFALRQQQVMIEGDREDANKVITEKESVERVERLLREEKRANRTRGRKAADIVGEWRAEKDAAAAAEEGEDADEKKKKKGGDAAAVEEDKYTLPSILHDRPRAVRALGIWSARLTSVPYSRWTVGAATALDHWIAREVLRMDELTWRQVLEGGGTDAYSEGMETLPGGETRRGLLSRMRDIVLARSALFPETLSGTSSASAAGEGGLAGELEEDLLSTTSPDGSSKNATEKSIDDLLASLGEFDDDDDDTWRFDDDEDRKRDADDGDRDDAEEEKDSRKERERLVSIMDELQVWRERNASSPYEDWDAGSKDDFDKWIEGYVATLYPEADAGSVDREATRASLLSARPLDGDKTRDFWGKIRTETEADVFLRDYRSSAREELEKMGESTAVDDDDGRRAELEAILSVPYEEQLDKLADMGTLRPILDDYVPGSERASFLEKYTPMFLEGLEMEHLVPDPDGPIGLDDLSPAMREEMSGEWSPGDDGGGQHREPRFAIRMVAYGTDEYGTSRAEKARELYRIWNEHKATRARFEEALFKRGRLGLEEDGQPRFKRRVKKDPKDKKK